MKCNTDAVKGCGDGDVQFSLMGAEEYWKTKFRGEVGQGHVDDVPQEHSPTMFLKKQHNSFHG